MANITYLSIDGVVMPTPSKYTPVYSDFDSDDSVRNEVGVLSRNCIRQGQVAPKFKWQNITTETLGVILKAIDGKVSMEVTFFDPLYYVKNNGAMHTFTGYVQATRQPEMTLQAERPEDIRWTIELSFIEF